MRISLRALQACDPDPITGDFTGCGVSIEPTSSGGGMFPWLSNPEIPIIGGSGIPTAPVDWSGFSTGRLPSSPPPNSGYSANDWAKIITASASATSAGIRAGQSPYVIPGTNLVYNPATGQVGSSTGTTVSQVGTSLMPMLIVAALVAFVFMGRKS